MSWSWRRWYDALACVMSSARATSAALIASAVSSDMIRSRTGWAVARSRATSPGSLVSSVISPSKSSWGVSVPGVGRLSNTYWAVVG